MTVTSASFRTAFPEFANASVFPDNQVEFWINVATNLGASGAGLLNARRWGTSYDLGTQLFVAHNLVLEGRAQAEANAGAIPGVSTGAINSKSVDKVSVGYDTAGSSNLNAGHWNLSVYGTRFIQLARIMGAGPVTVGGGLYPYATWPGSFC